MAFFGARTQSGARRAATPSRRPRTRRAVGVTALVAAGAIATPAGSVSAANAAPTQPLQALESLHLSLGSDGIVTNVARTDMTTSDGTNYDHSGGGLSPSVAGQLPIAVSTAWTYDGQTGTDLSRLKGKSGQIELDVTVTNTSTHVEPFTVTAPDNSQLHTYAMVSTPVTVVGSVNLPQGAADQVVLPRGGVATAGVTNGAVASGSNTTVQWSAVLAPPRLAPSATFRLVLNAHDFQLPQINLSAQAGLVSDPSVQALYNTAFGQNSPLTQVQNATAALTDSLANQLGTTSGLLDQIRGSLAQQGSIVGPAALNAFNSTASASIQALDSILTALQALNRTATDLLNTAKSEGQQSLATALTKIVTYIGAPQQAPDTSTAPAVPDTSCDTQLAGTMTADTLYGQLLQARTLMYQTSNASDACIKLYTAQLQQIIGTSTQCPAASDPQPLVCQFSTAASQFQGIKTALDTAISSASSTFNSTQSAFDSTMTSLNQQVGDLQQALLDAQNATSNASKEQQAIATIGKDVNTAVATLATAQSDAAAHGQDLADGRKYAHDTLATQVGTISQAMCRLVTDNSGNTTAVGSPVPHGYADETADLQALRDTVNKNETCSGSLATSTTPPAADDLQAKITQDLANWQKAIDSNTTLSNDLSNLSTQLTQVQTDVSDAKGGSLGGVTQDLTKLLSQSCSLLLTSLCSTNNISTASGPLNTLQTTYDGLITATNTAVTTFQNDVANGMSGVRTILSNSQNSLLAGGSTAYGHLGGLQSAIDAALRTSGDTAVGTGWKALTNQQAAVGTLVAQSSGSLGSQMDSIIGEVTAGVAPAVGSVNTAKTQLQGAIAKALGDMHPVIAMFTSKAAELGQGVGDLGDVQNQAAGFGEVRKSEVFDQLLAQAQLNQGLREMSTLPYFGSALPSGSKHVAVYAFTIAGTN